MLEKSATVVRVVLVARMSISMFDLLVISRQGLMFLRVNSKAQLRVPVDRLLPLLPPVLHEGILASRYYAQGSSSLVIQADESRKQPANKETCFRKLTQLIVDEYKRAVPGETTADQKKKVEKLQHAENESRLKTKKLHASKKQSRSKGNMD
ncbi:hypothetical protein A1O1_06146 [Capronia coronata CBS 617.96]|uniref:Prokaryotic-type class I peptide chain release factors domain-containing protein n=1 Tax=Capronia coronata CBS 617.96 TaxID=1182541 RepID=W9XZW7_9EURO|nr:uncharacterized protein A1O1_06146 [Capronia coronata CBS 617.96]EXJ85778.1 hypothetical protein A1O1_06146 [Capronia coronata CBS 617.96]